MDNIKAQISEMTGFPPEQLRLTFAGKQFQFVVVSREQAFTDSYGRRPCEEELQEAWQHIFGKFTNAICQQAKEAMSAMMMKRHGR